VSDDDPVTGRRMLTGSAYADDRHIRSRMSIYAYAETAASPGWRTSMIPWDGTQIVADVGCGNGFDLRQIVPQGRCRHAIGVDLSAGMLRSLADLLQGDRLSLVQADAQRLPLPDDCVDVAMAMHRLYHVPDVAAGGRTGGRPADSFTTQTGTALLSQEFSSVTLRTFDVPLSIPSAQPVITYVGSLREPTLALVREPLDFDAVLDDIAMNVEQAIEAEGTFRATTHTGVFICR
jgi:SAM-dependent methyltransferase